MKPFMLVCFSLLLIFSILPMLAAFRTGWTEIEHKIDDSKVLTFSRTFAVPIDQLWQRWTTNQGIQTFFAQSSDIDIRPGGNYHIIFQPSAPEGERGAELHEWNVIYRDFAAGESAA